MPGRATPYSVSSSVHRIDLRRGSDSNRIESEHLRYYNLLAEDPESARVAGAASIQFNSAR